eukprot:gene2674-3317_t
MYHSRPVLKGTKSNFSLTVNVSSISDDRVKQFLRTEILVKEWIEEVLQIKISLNLYESLRNGIVLCYLVNAIENNVVPVIQENTTVAFKLKENVNFFLMALEEIGVPKHKRFQLNDLFEGENLVRVVECLATLAKIAVDKGFSIAMKPIDPKSPVTMPTGEGLKMLKMLLAQIKEPTKNSNGTSRKGAAILKAQMALLAGNSVDFAKAERGFTKFQALWRGYKTRLMVIKMKRDVAYRARVAQEIYQTEMDYVKNLNICITCYMEPLLKSEVLTKEQAKTIFSDIHIIYSFGNKLLEKLKPRLEKWYTYQKLGDIFCFIAECLKVYATYVQNYNHSMVAIEELKKKEKFLTALTDCQALPNVKNLVLPAFLILPIQRVPRYNLLLTDMVKHTWSEHPDYKDLCEANDRMKSVASFLNEKKREGESFTKFTEIQTSFTGKAPLLFSPSRRLIKEGAGFLLNQKKEEIILYLFNDILVYGKPSKGIMSGNTKKVKYLGTIELSTIKLDEQQQQPQQLIIKSSQDNSTILNLSSKNEPEVAEWKQEIQKLLGSIVEKQKSKNVNNSTATPTTNATENIVEPTPEQQLHDRRKNKVNQTNGTGNNNSQSPSNNVVTINTSVSLPNSPIQSPPPEPNNPPNSPTQVSSPPSSTPTSPSTSSSTPSQNQSSFIGSLFGGGSKKKGGTFTASELSPPNSPSHSQSDPGEPTSPQSDSNTKNTTLKQNRPKKNKKGSSDDSSINVKKSNKEDGGRSRASSRLQRLTGTFRRKKDKDLFKDDDLKDDEEEEEKSTPPTIVQPEVDPTTTTTTTTTSSLNTSNNNNSTTTDNLESSTTASLARVYTKLNEGERAPLNILISSGGSSTSNKGTDNRLSVNSNSSNEGGATDLTNSQHSLASSVEKTESNTLTLEEILSKRSELDALKLESYLSDTEFKKLFNADREQFYKFPKWKQDKRKMELKLL